MRSLAIEATRLKKSYGLHQAVKGVDLAIATGEIYGFIGPNGAGKSTTVKMLCTRMKPSAGRVKICGLDTVTSPFEVRSKIGVVLQAAAIDPKLTGRELLEVHGELHGLTRKIVRARIDELDDVLNLGKDLDRPLGGYSGGMARRLDVVAALLSEPEVIFLDEPTTGLDPESRKRIWAKIAELNAENGTTVFLTTQYLEEADALAHRIGVINGGRLVAESTPSELKSSLGDDLIVVRVAKTEVLSAKACLAGLFGQSSVSLDGDEVSVTTKTGSKDLGIAALNLETAGISPIDLTLRRPTLDDVYMNLINESSELEEIAQ